jgi:capsular exopolysaccharide synthesis family protein
MDLKDIIAIAWKRRLTVLLVATAAVGAAAAFAYARTPQYEATATVAMTPNVQKGQGFVASDDLATLLSTYAAIVDSERTKSYAAQILGHPLHASVSASTTAGTGILQISATSTSPREAAAAAQALSQAFQSVIAGKNQLLVVQVVDPPTVPTSAVAPHPPLIIAAGLALGLGLGLALALMLERWFDRIETVEDIGELTSAPVLASLPRNRALRRGGRSSLIWDQPDLFRLQESFRALRTSLQFSLNLDRGVIQVTSASAGEGKSTVAANLAVAIASVGQPTLLVDADFRAPRQHVIFQLPNDIGLSTAMVHDGSVNAAISRSEFKNLSVLPTGPVPAGPTEVMAAHIGRTVAALRKLESVIVIDTPPVLPVSDARLVAAEADVVLMVALAGRTRSSALRSALSHVVMGDRQMLGMVLNQTRERATLYGGYGSPYYQTHHPIELAEREYAARPAD